MPAAPHLLVAITAHGYGHATQAGAAVRALRDRLPDLRVTVQAILPADFLADTMGGPVAILPEPADTGLVMASTFEVLVEDSAAAYARFHADWDARVAAAATRLAALAPDLVLADVPYLPLAAAKRAGIPAVALCSLNWADVYRHYCGHRPEATAIHAEILAAYASADLFLVPEPGMPMPDLPNIRRIGPCARIGNARRAELASRLGLSGRERIVLVSMGGIPWAMDYAAWPRIPDTHFIVQAETVPARPDMTPRAALDMSTTDVLRSCDALVSKPGYSLIAESACNATPLLYVPRADWPETPYLRAWVERHNRAAEIDFRAFARGELADPLDALLSRSPLPPVIPSGNHEAAGILLAFLQNRFA